MLWIVALVLCGICGLISLGVAAIATGDDKAGGFFVAFVVGAIQKLAGDIKIALIPSGQGVIIDPTTLFGKAP